MTQQEIDKLAKAIGREIAKSQKETLTTEEAAEYLGVSTSTLYKYTMNREIPHFKPKGRMCYFKRKDLDEWMLSGPVATSEELDMRVMDYCSRTGIPVSKNNMRNLKS